MINEAIKLLNELGNSSEEVAQSLKDCEIKGKKKRACDCPIANFLSKHLNVVDVDVNPNEIDIYDYDQHFSLKTIPPAVAEFIVDFDKGKFDFLVE